MKEERKNDEDIKVIEALSASGLRACRYSLECQGIEQIIANDLSQSYEILLRIFWLSNNGVVSLASFPVVGQRNSNYRFFQLNFQWNLPLGEKFFVDFRFSNSIINLLFCLFIIVKILLTCKSHSAVEEIKKNKEFNKCKNIKPNQDDAINLMTQHRTKET